MPRFPVRPLRPLILSKHDQQNAPQQKAEGHITITLEVKVAISIGLAIVLGLAILTFGR